ncbi:hypothetical protein EH199_12185 [Novosphingobium sp. LASN5T]|nr:hypothetical protein EH199_12185 [Novosphingobium sp. LASN5T]
MQSLTLPRRASVKGLGKTLNIAIPVAIAALAASAAYAGADTTFTPALTKFTYMPSQCQDRERRGPTASKKEALWPGPNPLPAMR